MDDSGFDEVVLPEGTQRARLMAYGPIVGEHHDAAMYGPNRNPLRPGDVAASPDYGFQQGDVVDVGDGTLRTVADWSYLHPGIPTSKTIELRNKQDQGRGYVQKVNFDEVVLPSGEKQAATPSEFDEVVLPKQQQQVEVPTYAPQVVTPQDEQAAPTADEEHDLLYYKTGKTKSEREALNAPLREAMQVPLVSPETIGKGLQAVSEIGATRPEDLQQGPVQKSINDEIAKAISGLTTGEGAASLPLYAFPATAAGLTAENVQELPGQIGEAVTQVKQGDYPGAASAATKAALNALMIGGVLHGGAELTGGEPAAAARTVLERRKGILDRKAELTARAANGEQGLEAHLAAVEAELNDTATNPVVHAPPPEPPTVPQEAVQAPQTGDLWYQGVSADGVTQWVTHDPKIAADYAKRRGLDAKVNVYTAEQVGANAFADNEGNLMSPQEYAKNNWSTTIQQQGGPEGPRPKPIRTISIEEAEGPQVAETPPEPYTPEAAAAQPQPVIPPEDVKYAGGGPQTEVPGTVGISQARTEAELGPGSVVPGVGAEMGSGLAHGRDYINKGGDPRLPIRRANTSGMVGKNDVGIVHAELDRLRVERSKAAAALEANPGDPVLQQNFSLADDAQRAWRKELQPVLTKASDALREAHAASMPDADVGTYQGLADLMDEHFKGERVVTPEMRTAMAKAARGVKESRNIVNGEMAKVEDTLTRQIRGKKVMTPAELDADLRSELETQFADCVLGA